MGCDSSPAESHARINSAAKGGCDEEEDDDSCLLWIILFLLALCLALTLLAILLKKNRRDREEERNNRKFAEFEKDTGDDCSDVDMSNMDGSIGNHNENYDKYRTPRGEPRDAKSTPNDDDV